MKSLLTTSEQKNIFTPADYESLNGIESFLNEISVWLGKSN